MYRKINRANVHPFFQKLPTWKIRTIIFMLFPFYVIVGICNGLKIGISEWKKDFFIKIIEK